MLEQMPILPEIEGEKYFILSMKWFERWKNYVLYEEPEQKVNESFDVND